MRKEEKQKNTRRDETETLMLKGVFGLKNNIDVLLPSPTVGVVFEFHGSPPPVKLPVEPQPEKTNTRTLKPPCTTRGDTLLEFTKGY